MTALIAFLIGMLLLLMAAPRLVGAIVGMPGDRVVFALKEGEVVTDEALEGLVLARRAALFWHERAQAHRDIGMALLALIYRDSGGAVYRARLAAAEQAVRRALALGPVDPYSWTRLATIIWLGERDAAGASAALRTSVRVGAYDPRLAEWRTRLALTLWPQLSLDDRLLYLDQIRQLWRHDPDALARLVLDERAFQTAVAALLDPASVAELEARRDALRAPPASPAAGRSR